LHGLAQHIADRIPIAIHVDDGFVNVDFVIVDIIIITATAAASGGVASVNDCVINVGGWRMARSTILRHNSASYMFMR
jgi:hypothetical protein